MKAGALEVGLATLTRGGETESGDRHLVAPFDRGTLIAVADGLGHGEDAARAARLAVETLRSRPEEPPLRLLRRCHEALHGTRGVVLSLASFDHARGTLSWTGVGNVWGALYFADPRASPRREFLLLRNGVVGVRLPTLQVAALDVRPGDTLLLATDGVRADSVEALPRSLPAQQLAEEILARHQRGEDDALVLVARLAGRRP